MIILLILGFAASLYCLGLAFMLAARALPVYLALCTGFLLHHLGASPLFSCVCALVIGAIVMSGSQKLFHHAKDPATRTISVVAVILPAAFAGYQLALGLARLAVESTVALHALGVIGAVVVSRLAWQRLASQPVS